MLEKLQLLNLRYLWNTRRYLVLGVGLFGLTVVMGFFALYRQVMTNWDLYSKLRTSQARVERLERKNAQLSQLQTSELLQASTQINASLPSQKPLTPLLLGLNSVSRSSGVTLDSVALSPGEVSTASGATNQPKKNGKYDAIELELTVGGTLDQINAFLHDIERFAPFSTVSNLELSKKTREVGNVFEADLIITTYYFTQSVKVTTDSLASVTLNANQQEALASIRSFLFPQYQQPTNIQGGGLEDLFGIEELEVLSN